ncbi:MAG: hypothetical protein WBW61_04140 [Rhodanobacteraceae bacterium]
MTDHVDFAVSSCPRSRAFHAAAPAPLGCARLMSTTREQNGGNEGPSFGKVQRPPLRISDGAARGPVIMRAATARSYSIHNIEAACHAHE